MQHRCQFSGPAPAAVHSLGSGTLLPHGRSKEKQYLVNQLCLKNNWTHMVLPHLFFTVNFTNPSHGRAWPQASCFRPQHELLLLLPSTGHCSQTSSKGHYNSCSKRTCTPASRHKAQPNPGPRAGSNTGPSAAPGKLVWVTWLWVKVCEQEVLNKNCLLSLLLRPPPQLRLVMPYIPR